MNKHALAAIATFAALTLAGCGGRESASEDPAADTVEMPAEEALGGATAMPSDMAPGDVATEPAMAPSSSAAL